MIKEIKINIKKILKNKFIETDTKTNPKINRTLRKKAKIRISQNNSLSSIIIAKATEIIIDTNASFNVILIPLYLLYLKYHNTY